MQEKLYAVLQWMTYRIYWKCKDIHGLKIDYNVFTYRQLLTFLCIRASEYRSIFWSETEQEHVQNCLFNFTAQLCSVQEDIMKLIWVRERSIILTVQAEMKNKIIQSDSFCCKCWLCQADITKMATILPH